MTHLQGSRDVGAAENQGVQRAMTLDEDSAFETIGVDGEDFQASDGNRIYVYNTGGKSRPMLFLHTLRTQAEFHHKVLPAFVEDHDCYLLDWPGHGRSSKDPSAAYTADYMVGQIAEFIAARDLKDLVLVGESIGGTGVLSLAARIPERVRSVYASNPYDAGLIIGKPAGKAVSWLGQHLSVVTKDEMRPITKYLMGGGFYDTSRLEDRFVDLISNNARNDKNFGAAFHSLLAHQKTWHGIRTNDYPRIPEDLPVVLHYGRQDWSPDWVREDNEKKLGGDLKVVVNDRVGHFSFLEAPQHMIGLIRLGEN